MLHYRPIYYYFGSELTKISKKAREPYGIIAAATDINNPHLFKTYINPPQYTDYGIWINIPPNETTEIPDNDLRQGLATKRQFPEYNLTDPSASHNMPTELFSFEPRESRDIAKRIRDQLSSNLIAPPTTEFTQRTNQSAGNVSNWTQNNRRGATRPQNSNSILGRTSVAYKEPASFISTVTNDEMDDEIMTTDSDISPMDMSLNNVKCNRQFNNMDLTFLNNVSVDIRDESGRDGTIHNAKHNYPEFKDIDLEYLTAIYTNDFDVANRIYEESKNINKNERRMTRLRPFVYKILVEVLRQNFYNHLTFDQFRIASIFNQRDLNGNDQKIVQSLTHFAFYLAVPVLKHILTNYADVKTEFITVEMAKNFLARDNYDLDEGMMKIILDKHPSRLDYFATVGVTKIGLVAFRREELQLPTNDRTYDSIEFIMYMLRITSNNTFEAAQVPVLFTNRLAAQTTGAITVTPDVEFPHNIVGNYKLVGRTKHNQNKFRKVPQWFTEAFLNSAFD